MEQTLRQEKIKIASVGARTAPQRRSASQRRDKMGIEEKHTNLRRRKSPNRPIDPRGSAGVGRWLGPAASFSSIRF